MEKSNDWNGTRMKTNITGLDRLLYGGLNPEKKSFILIKGASDTEKTVFGMQMLYGISQSLSEKDITIKSKYLITPHFISTYNSKKNMDDLALDAFISTCVRNYQKRNLHHAVGQKQSSSCFTKLLFNTDRIICKDCASSQDDIIPFSEITNNPERLIVEGALYYNVRTHALHMKTSEQRDGLRNMIYQRKYETITQYLTTRNGTDDEETELQRNDISQALKDIVGVRMVNLITHKIDCFPIKDYYSDTQILGLELKSYLKFEMQEIKKDIDLLRKDKKIMILICDERTTVFDDDADMIIDLSSEYADDYLSHYFRITKSRLQETALGYHQYKRREFGIEVFPSVHFYIQHRWYFRRGLLYTHSDVISERFFEYIDRKKFHNKENISYLDYIASRDCNKQKRYEDMYQLGLMNVSSYDLLNKILIGEIENPSTDTENIYGNAGSVTGVIGNGNTYKRFLTFGSAFSTTLGDDHLLILLLNKEDSTIRRRLPCPARLSKRKHKEECECLKCYEHIHFMNIPMGAITPEEFLYYYNRQLKSIYEKGKRIKRVILDDLQMLDYCYPKLSKDPLFLPALMNISREYGIALYLLCDKQCKLRDPLRALADNIICTDKTEKGKPKIYIERYAGYNFTPSKMYCGEVTDVEKLFVCLDQYNDKGARIRKMENYSIDSTVIKDKNIIGLTEYWEK